MKLIKMAFATTIALTAQLSFAAFNGTQSYNTHIEVGESTVNAPPAHTAGLAGIGIHNMGLQNKVDFQGLAQYSQTINGVFKLVTGPTSQHGGLGTFNFVKVGNQDVWFGEWADAISPYTVNDGNRAVFYIGDSSGTTLPTSGMVHYNIKGINHFTNGNVLTGSFHANFSNNTVWGELTGSILGMNAKIKLGNGTINSANASFGGSASYSNVLQTSLSSAIYEGNFFGTNAQAVVGIIKHSNIRSYDVSFGGERTN